jgi:hypothetical protein
MLWACALMPLFVVPPLVSLVYALTAMRRRKKSPFHINEEWLAIVSALNIVISVVAWMKFNAVAADLALAFTARVQSLLSVYAPQRGTSI